MMPISIHAPHTGRDAAFLPGFCGCDIFQSTRPIRGATPRSSPPTRRLCYFNPRAPYGARRSSRSTGPRRTEISIHAPHTGRDPPRAARRRPGCGFQSTRPIRGATAQRGQTGIRIEHFNPRAPYGARPLTLFSTAGGTVFQSTRPIRGATNSVSGVMFTASDFNPRAPYGARLVRVKALRPIGDISIHAPHTGRDQ